jgi:hypothetical protein
MAHTIGHSAIGRVVLSVLLLAPATLVAQSTADSLASAILSTDLEVRSTAVSRALAEFSVFPAQIAQSVSTLIKREAANRASTPSNDEGYAEFILDLSIAAMRTGDKSTARALIALGGTGVSSAIAGFVASAGPSVIPALDSAALVTSEEAESILQTFALMYTAYGSQLSAADSALVLSRILAAASSSDPIMRMQFVVVMTRMPLPEALPLLQQLAASDTSRLMPEGIYLVRREAASAVTELQASYTALAPGPLASALERQRAAACSGATGSTDGHCQSMRSHLDAAIRRIADHRNQQAKQSIESFLKSLDMASSGLAPALARMLRVNAERIAALLD